MIADPGPDENRIATNHFQPPRPQCRRSAATPMLGFAEPGTLAGRRLRSSLFPC
jgi:hypothetical protein